MIAVRMPRSPSVRRLQPERWPHGPALLCVGVICGAMWLGVIWLSMIVMSELLGP